jgi:hypothetical protein
MTPPAVIAGALGTVSPSGLHWHSLCELAAGEADQAGLLTVVASTMATAAAQCLAWVVGLGHGVEEDDLAGCQDEPR